MQWTDANIEQWEQLRAQGRIYPEPERGVAYVSDCKRWRVTVAATNVPAEERTWTVWEMGAAPMPMVLGLQSHTVAMRAAEAVARSRALRVALRLASLGRAVWAGVRRLTA